MHLLAHMTAGHEREHESWVLECRDRVTRLIEWAVHVDRRLDQCVTREEFSPVKLIAYGLAASTLLAVLSAVLSRVVLR